MTHPPTTAGVSCLELDCTAYQLERASTRYNQSDVEFFSCHCGPMSQADLAGLEHAALTGMCVRLLFPKFRILLAEVEMAHVGSSAWVRIVGRVMERDGELPRSE